MSWTGRHAERRTPLLPADGPLRRTRRRDPAQMTRRAWTLLGLHVLLPGSAQMVAGTRAVGRVALTVALALWALVLVVILVWVVQPDILVGVLTSATGLTVVQVGLLVLAVGWLALTLDTLRLARVLRTKPVARPVLASALVLLSVLGAGGAAWGAYLSGVARGAIVSVFPAAEAEHAAQSLGRYNILLAGIDRVNGAHALQPESLSVVSVDARTGAATMIGLPVQLREVPFVATSPMHRLYPKGYGSTGCIAKPCALENVYSEAQAIGVTLYPDAKAEHTSPGMQAVREAVEGVLGITVQYAVQVDTGSFGELVDALGGATIDVPQRSVETGGAPVAFPAGEQHMNGARAVQYIRGEASANDYGQVARTQQVEAAMLRQANPANVLLQFRTIASAGSGAVQTDLPQDLLTDLTVLALKTRGQQARQVELVPPLVANPLKPDDAAIRRVVAAATRS